MIQDGIIGRVSTVRAWTPRNRGYDSAAPKGEDLVPEHLDWNLWLGAAFKRLDKKEIYHPGKWRNLLDYGCGTLGDTGVHILDTLLYNALQLDSTKTITNKCREPNGFGFPEKKEVTYQFTGTKYTTENHTWIWSDGEAPVPHEDLKLPNDETLFDQVLCLLVRKEDRIYHSFN